MLSSLHNSLCLRFVRPMHRDPPLAKSLCTLLKLVYGISTLYYHFQSSLAILLSTNCHRKPFQDSIRIACSCSHLLSVSADLKTSILVFIDVLGDGSLKKVHN